MNVLNRLSDYKHAINTSVMATSNAYVLAANEVLTARLRYGLGPLYYSLFRLYSQPRETWSKYILDTDTEPLFRKINGRYHSLARDKLAFAHHCRENGLATVPTICCLREPEQRHPQTDYFVTDLKGWTNALANAPNELFIKPLSGAHGADAFSARRSGDKWLVGREAFSTRKLYERLLTDEGTRKSWIVQPAVQPHEHLRGIMPNHSLGTIRFVTYHDRTGVARTAFAVIRLPAKGNVTDNFGDGRKGNIVAPVDLVGGTIGPALMSRSSDWPQMSVLTHHPDTNALVTGLTIPFWSETLALVMEAQTCTPQLPTIGWDIAITDQGPLIVEANTIYGVLSLQVAYQQGMRDEILNIISGRALAGPPR